MQGRYNRNTNRFTLEGQFNYAFQDWRSDDLNRTPSETEPNNKLYLRSRQAGKAIVDWGDGKVESFDFVRQTDGTYVCSWRTLHTEEVSRGKRDWFGLEYGTDSYIIPYPNHQYADGLVKDRKITITCTNEIYSFYSYLIKWYAFPIIESASLEWLNLQYTKHVNEIPMDRIANMKNLQSLILSALGVKLEVIPSSLFTMQDLKSLQLSKLFRLQDPDASNLRQIRKLQKLESLNLSDCDVSKYIKEFNELPKLKYLDISSNDDYAPSYDEVSSLNPSLAANGYDWLTFVSRKVEWDSLMDIGGIERIDTLNCWDSYALNVQLHDYIYQMRSMTLINFGQALRTQQRVDDFVNALYGQITYWPEITYAQTAKDGKRNQYYKLNVIIYSSLYKADLRPSGSCQAPQGFVEGVSNGSPASPMEKIYVLTKNYAQEWTVRPEASNKVARSLTAVPEGYYLDDSEILSYEGIIRNHELKKITTE